MRRPKDQQGAIAIAMSLIICVVLLPMAALAVDIGVQRVARRDMQAVADVVALDLSRQLTGGRRDTYTAAKIAQMQQLAEASRDRNDSNVGEGSGGKSADIRLELGVVNTQKFGAADYAEFFHVAAMTETVNAVRVTASAKVGFGLASILPGQDIGSGRASRSAIATTQSSACFKLGSYAAAIDSKGSTLLNPLNSLLGLNLGVLSYQGLAAANLTLAGLAADSHIGSVDTLVNGNVSLGNFTAAAIAVLEKQDKPGNAVAISALQAIRASGINLSKPVAIGKIVSLASTDTAALTSDLNVLDLVAGAIQVANGEHGVDIPTLRALGVTGDIKVTQGITTRCGVPNDNSPTAIARASQVYADLTVPLTVPAASVLGLSVTGEARITGGIGNATGRLVSPNPIVCGAGSPASPDSYSVAVTNALAGLSVATNVEINGTAGTAQLGVLGNLLQSLGLGNLIEIKFEHVKLAVGAGTTPQSGAQANLRVPQNSYNATPRGVPVTTGSNSAYGGLGVVPGLINDPAIMLSGKITITTKLALLIPVVAVIDLSKDAAAGKAIAAVLGGVNTVLDTAVNVTVKPLLNTLLTQLGQLLGINVGGADVYSVSRPTCHGSKLAG